MRDLSCCLFSLFVLSCSQDPHLSSPSVSDEQSGPWQTVSINGVTYQRVDAKATATRSDLLHRDSNSGRGRRGSDSLSRCGGHC